MHKYYKHVETKNYYKLEKSLLLYAIEGEYITVTNTSKGNLQVLEVLKPQICTVPPNIFQTHNIDGI